MSTRLRLLKNYNDYKKGDIIELRSAEAKQLIKNRVASVQTDMSAENYQTKKIEVKIRNGNPANIRTHNSR